MALTDWKKSSLIRLTYPIVLTYDGLLLAEINRSTCHLLDILIGAFCSAPPSIESPAAIRFETSFLYGMSCSDE